MQIVLFHGYLRYTRTGLRGRPKFTLKRTELLTQKPMLSYFLRFLQVTLKAHLLSFMMLRGVYNFNK
jgi:hypothetical protein